MNRFATGLLVSQTHMFKLVPFKGEEHAPGDCSTMLTRLINERIMQLTYMTCIDPRPPHMCNQLPLQSHLLS